MKAWILGVTLFLAGLVLATGLWLLGYHLTGKSAFMAWKAERVAQGDRLDWKGLAPPPVAPELNFAEHPLVRGAIREKGEADPRFKALAIPPEAAKVLGDWREGRRDDLEALSAAYGPKGLKASLAALEPGLAELRRASERPGCNLGVAYEEGEIPALLGFRGVIRTLRARASLELRAGHPERALEDVRTAFRVADHLKAEPTFLPALLRAAILNITLQVVWEGLEDHLWKPDQLALLQAECARVDLIGSLMLAWQGERLMFITSLSGLADNRPPRAFDDPAPRKPVGPMGRGWLYRNLLVQCQAVTHLVDVQEPGARRLHPGRAVDPKTVERRLRFRPDLVVARIGLPPLWNQAARFGYFQASLDHAAVVCALERYRLANGRYPDRLEDLAPGFLPDPPHDLVTGGPLRYAREGATFRLHQVGWDGQDQGGAPAFKAGEGKQTLDPTRGDWAWPHLR